jgi:hypothetical protein
MLAVVVVAQELTELLVLAAPAAEALALILEQYRQ